MPLGSGGSGSTEGDAPKDRLPRQRLCLSGGAGNPRVVDSEVDSLRTLDRRRGRQP